MFNCEDFSSSHDRSSVRFGVADLVPGGRATDSLGAEPVASDEDQRVSFCSSVLPSARGCACLPRPAKVRQRTGLSRATVLALHRAVWRVIDVARQSPPDEIVRRCRSEPRPAPHMWKCPQAVEPTISCSWDLPEPELILDVTGSASGMLTLDMPNEYALRRALLALSMRGKVWVITGGTNTGDQRPAQWSVRREGGAPSGVGGV